MKLKAAACWKCFGIANRDVLLTDW